MTISNENQASETSEHLSKFSQFRKSLLSERASVIASIVTGLTSLVTSIINLFGIELVLSESFRNTWLPILMALAATVVGFYFGKSKGE